MAYQPKKARINRFKTKKGAARGRRVKTARAVRRRPAREVGRKVRKERPKRRRK